LNEFFSEFFPHFLSSSFLAAFSYSFSFSSAAVMMVTMMAGIAATEVMQCNGEGYLSLFLFLMKGSDSNSPPVVNFKTPHLYHRFTLYALLRSY